MDTKTPGAALVTGAGSGIGKATALLLASVGHPIVAIDRDGTHADEVAELITRAGGRALASSLDVADSVAVNESVGQAIETFGSIDVLVSGAGYIQKTRFLEVKEADWDRMIDVHLKGAFNTSQAVVPNMKENGYGRIVCVSSMAGITGSVDHVHYGSAKAGLLGFVRALARDVGQWGITVNAVVPGAVDTPINAGLTDDQRALLANTPVGRVGQPEDVAHAIRYFASPKAGYVSGAHLTVNGGAN